ASVPEPGCDKPSRRPGFSRSQVQPSSLSWTRVGAGLRRLRGPLRRQLPFPGSRGVPASGSEAPEAAPSVEVAAEPGSPPSLLRAAAWELPAASRRSLGLLCVQPGKRPRSPKAGARRRVENLKVTNPVHMAAGAARLSDPGPRLRADSARRRVPRGSSGSGAPREARHSENPERPDTREREIWGARSAPRLHGPWIPRKGAVGSDLPNQTTRARAQLWSVCEATLGLRASPRKATKAFLWVVLSALQAAQSCGPSWGEGTGARRGDPRGDPGSRRLLRCGARSPNGRQHPPGCPGKAERGLQDPRGAEFEGASGSLAPARSPAVQTGV
ncbi:uncharacterized protein WCI35_022554, partial [Daubentonia madagascariensis]